MATVLITGGTGLIGTALTKELIAKGYEVIILTRQQQKTTGNKKGKLSYAYWDVKGGEIDPKTIELADYIVHLAGANVADGRWTEKRKQVIVQSRIRSGGLLVQALKEIPNKVKAVISSSAIGWYGPDPQVPNPKPFVETDKADDSFLGRTSQQWEESIAPVINLGKRLVTIRTGIVLSNDGGAFKEFVKPLNFGTAAILGNGKQIVSWIHINDIVGLYIFAIENEAMQGAYNGVAPQPVSNEKLIRSIADKKGGLAIPVHVPEFALKLALGEMSVEVLKSATVSSKKTEEAGYNFMFPSLEAAVQNLLR